MNPSQKVESDEQESDGLVCWLFSLRMSTMNYNRMNARKTTHFGQFSVVSMENGRLKYN